MNHCWGLVETCAEIIAKKIWHQGHCAKARDLFDLCAVADAEPEAIRRAEPFLAKHGAAFLQQLQVRAELAEAEFDAIDTISFQRSFAGCLEQEKDIIKPLLANVIG